MADADLSHLRENDEVGFYTMRGGHKIVIPGVVIRSTRAQVLVQFNQKEPAFTYEERFRKANGSRIGGSSYGEKLCLMTDEVREDMERLDNELEAREKAQEIQSKFGYNVRWSVIPNDVREQVWNLIEPHLQD